MLVQAENSTADTIAMLRVADAEPAVRGVVGWIPLTNSNACEAALDQLADDPHLVGVRHLVHDEPDPDWVVQPAVLRSLTVLAHRGLPFDLVAVLPRHLEHAATLARAIPDLTIVVDHLAKPPIRDHGWQPWAGLLAAAAAHDNVVAKMSGLNTAADPDRWTVEHLRPYVEHALDVFGPCRLMYGGDWPVTVTAGGYAKNWQATRALIRGLSHAEQAQVLGGTANAAYREVHVPEVRGDEQTGRVVLG